MPLFKRRQPERNIAYGYPPDSLSPVVRLHAFQENSDRAQALRDVIHLLQDALDASRANKASEGNLAAAVRSVFRLLKEEYGIVIDGVQVTHSLEDQISGGMTTLLHGSLVSLSEALRHQGDKQAPKTNLESAVSLFLKEIQENFGFQI